jgi:DNA-binding Lrp family transcriptional regulator
VRREKKQRQIRPKTFVGKYSSLVIMLARRYMQKFNLYPLALRNFGQIYLIRVQSGFIVPHQPDLLDGRILKEIQSPGSFRWDVRESYSRIAKRLGIDEDTIRQRLARLRQDGIIGKFVLLLNPHLLGRNCAAIYLELRDSRAKEQAISTLKLMDEIVSITSIHQEGLLLIIYYKEDISLTRHVNLIESVCGAKASMFWKIPFPRFDGEMSKTDWMIIEALRKDPRKKSSDLAFELGISSRTVNRRVTRLNNRNAFFLELDIDLKKAGGLPYLLLVHCHDEARKREVDSEIISGLQKLAYSDTAPTNHSVFSFACQNVSEADSILSWVKKVNGVSDLKAGILESRTFVEHWIDEEVHMRKVGFE